MRITNTNKAAQSAVFTIFVLVKGHVVARLQGSADSARAGKTVTLQLTSQDKYMPGNFAIDFQTAVTHYWRPTALIRSKPPGPAKDSGRFLAL